MSETVLLLVDKPGHLRDALHSLVNAMADLEKVVTADSGLLALKAAREIHPGIIVLGSQLAAAEVLEFLRRVPSESPKASCLLLTDSRDLARQACAAGADQALLGGLSASQLFAAIRRTLPGRREVG